MIERRLQVNRFYILKREFTPAIGVWYRLGLVMSLMVGLSAGAAVAAPSPAPAETSKLGRENPYRPLIQKRSATMTFEAPLSGPVGLPPALPVPESRPLMDTLEFVGVAYDNGEAIAAVSVDGKTMLMKKGEQLDGATVMQITPHKLVWRKANRTIIKHIRRSTRS